MAGFTYNLRFPGQIYHAASQNTYNYFRDYEPRTGRYIQSDPIGLGGGINTYGYVGGNPVVFFDAFGLVTQEEIVNTAKKYKWSEKWAYDVSKDNFKKNTNKCNKFVYDVLTEAGAPVPTPNGLFNTSPPSAGQWGDPNYKIPGWKVVDDPQNGDVVAVPHRYSDATGHVGIVSGNKKSISANDLTVEEKKWPWDKNTQPQGKPVYRRCECLD